MAKSTAATSNIGDPADVELVQVQFVHRHGERTPIKAWLTQFVSPTWSQCHVASTFHATAEAVQQLMVDAQAAPVYAAAHEQFHPASEASDRPVASDVVYDVASADPRVSTGSSVSTESSVRARGSADTSARPLAFVTDANLHAVGPIQKHVEDVYNQWGGDPSKKHAPPSTAPVPGLCFFGQLTDKGRETLYQLGTRLRKTYIEKYGLLPERYGDENGASSGIYLRSTDYPRTIESLQHLLGGLYPRSTRDSPVPPIIYTRWYDDETLYANGNCARWRTLSKQFKEAYHRTSAADIERMKTKHAHFLADPTNPTLHALYDTFIAMQAHGMKLPGGVTAADVKELEAHANSQWFKIYETDVEARRLAIGRLVEEMRQRTEEAVHRRGDGGHYVRMAIYSGHDSTIGPLLGAFEVSDGYWPPFAANFAVELYRQTSPTRGNAAAGASGYRGKLSSTTAATASAPAQQHYVRMKYNERTLQVPYCTQSPDRHHPSDPTLCTYAAFLEMAKRVVPVDYHEECKEKGADGVAVSVGLGDRDM